METNSIVLIAALLGLIPAAIAAATVPPADRWRAFVAWWVFGALVFVVALPMAIVQYSRASKIRRQAS